MKASEEEAIDLARGRLHEREAAYIQRSLFEGGSVGVCRLENLSPVGVPYGDSFDPTDYPPISSSVRRFSRSYDGVVKRKIDNMLKTRITKPACSP